jgi:hypothetical protein
MLSIPQLDKLVAINKSTKQNSFSYYMSITGYTILSLILFLIGLFCIAMPFFADKVFPFHLLSKIENTTGVIEALGGKGETGSFAFGVKILMVVCGLLALFLGSMVNAVKNRNKIIQNTSTSIKEILKANEKELQDSLKAGNKIEESLVARAAKALNFEAE